MKILGYFHGVDPAACLVIDGRIVAFVEEERLIRFKHASGIFPIRSIESCLKQGGLRLEDLDCFAVGWNAPHYSNGGMARFYDGVNERYPPDEATLGWQRRNLGMFHEKNQRARLEQEIVKHFGVRPADVPALRFFPHHASHAAASFFTSSFDEALVLTLDGSGDEDCTTVWHGKGRDLTPLHRVPIPHSLGWFYAAITELLGFDAYDGEYKVMGLAAYGRENLTFREKLAKVVKPGQNGWDYEVDGRYIHRGPHTFSSRFTDHLPELLGLAPRQGPVKLEKVHEDLAYEAQHALEQHVLRLLAHFRQETGLRNVCIGGGVGLNVKLSSKILYSGLFDDVFAFPVPSDSGTAVGAALGLEVEQAGRRPPPLEHLYCGPQFTDADIEAQIRSCGHPYRKCEDVADATAELLSQGKVVGWFQQGMEAGPRALGARSILADPRNIAARDRVNMAIKFREYWRPFCPSLTEEDASRFMTAARPAPYMILAFEATKEAKRTVPAVVHVDGTMRVQTVSAKTNPRYHAMLKAFERRTGVPVVLNTSFNVKGEAMICTPRDAFRTFWSTGIDALAIGSFIIEKPCSPEAALPEEVLR
jgi:carbamoyltransferase